jgi:hypothetical protein
MTREEAFTKAARMFGKAGRLWLGRHGLSSPERRAEAAEQREQLKGELASVDAEIKERLAATEWYQALLDRRRTIRDQLDQADHNADYYRFSVGRAEGFADFIAGKGDTWEQAFADAESKAVFLKGKA